MGCDGCAHRPAMLLPHLAPSLPPGLESSSPLLSLRGWLRWRCWCCLLSPSSTNCSCPHPPHSHNKAQKEEAGTCLPASVREPPPPPQDPASLYLWHPAVGFWARGCAGRGQSDDPPTQTRPGARAVTVALNGQRLLVLSYTWQVAGVSGRVAARVSEDLFR